MDLPEPLTPPDCDLHGMNFMPLDVIRLTNSDFFAKTSGESFKCAVTLWCKSWLQVPAGSLPNDEKVLAFLSGAGSKWKRLRSDALDGFIECADGRLYHPVIAEKALEAWEKRGSFREQTEEKLSRQQRWRERQKQLSQQLRDVGVTPPVGASLSTLETLLSSTMETQASTVPSTPTSTVDARETPKTGTGTGTGTVPPTPVYRLPTPEPDNPVSQVMSAGRFVVPPSDMNRVHDWIKAGADLQTDILPIVERVTSRLVGSTGKPPFTFKIFEAEILAKVAADAALIERGRKGRERLLALDAKQRADDAAAAVPRSATA